MMSLLQPTTLHHKQHVCIRKCCLRRPTVHSINKWCTASPAWKHSASERSERAVLSQDVKVLSVTGSCSRVTHIKAMQEGASLQSAPTINSCENTAIFMGTEPRREHKSFWLISRPEWKPELRHIQQASMCMRVCWRQTSIFHQEELEFTGWSDKDLDLYLGQNI